jgi:putative membrane protein
MLLRLALRWVGLAAVVGWVAGVVPGISVHGGFGTLLWLALLISLVNAVVGPVLRLLSAPLIFLTLGLFLLVVNAALFGLVAALSSHLAVAGFGPAVLAGLLVAVFGWLAETLLPLRPRRS